MLHKPRNPKHLSVPYVDTMNIRLTNVDEATASYIQRKGRVIFPFLRPFCTLTYNYRADCESLFIFADEGDIVPVQPLTECKSIARFCKAHNSTATMNVHEHQLDYLNKVCYWKDYTISYKSGGFADFKDEGAGYYE